MNNNNFILDGKDFFAKEARHISRLLSYKTFRSVKISSKTEYPNEYWVQPRWILPDYGKMATFCKAISPNSYHMRPKLNALCMVHREPIWCRARVCSINPLRVFYIDVGFSECVRAEALYELPKPAREVIPMAVRIKLKRGTPSKYHGMSVRMILKIKLVDLLPDMRAIVEVKDE